MFDPSTATTAERRRHADRLMRIRTVCRQAEGCAGQAEYELNFGEESDYRLAMDLLGRKLDELATLRKQLFADPAGSTPTHDEPLKGAAGVPC